MPVAAAVVFLLSLVPEVQSPGSAARPDCTSGQECQALALDAYDRHDFERFHDLAWRAIQYGPTRTPSLMYLLARAQGLSGRPDDAAVMLGRLAEQGVATDAATNPDFTSVRGLSSWPALQRQILVVAASGQAIDGRDLARRAAMAAASATPARAIPESPVTAGPTPAVAASPARAAAEAETAPTALLTVREALRLPLTAIVPAGLAYDRVSERFVLADRAGRRLVIADERSRHVVDLVNADSAGFHDITGIEIDWRRGDLWVVSVDDPGNGGAPASTLHKLQLVSGRPLERLSLPGDFGGARFVDVSVSPGGTVFMLDALGGRVFAVEPGSKHFALKCVLAMTHATTIAVVDDRFAYVAHASGLMRVDTLTGSSQLVRNGPEPALLGLEHLRWARDALVGIAHLPDGRKQAVSIPLVDGGLRAARVDVLDADVALGGPDAVTLTADGMLYFLTKEPDPGGDGSFVVRSVRTR